MCTVVSFLSTAISEHNATEMEANQTNWLSWDGFGVYSGSPFQ